MISVLRSLLFYVAFYGGSVPFVLGAVLSIPVSKRMLLAWVRGWSRYHRICARACLGIRVRVEGHLPDEPILIVIKHESFFEAIDTPWLLRRPSVFAKEELFAIPGWGVAAKRFGLVPVARERGATSLRRMIARAREMVADGRPLVLFPEGTRVPHGQRAPLKAGFAGLYKLLGLPVVPIAVNSGPLYHRRWKRAGTIFYRVGETIPAGLPREEAEGRVLDALNALNDT